MFLRDKKARGLTGAQKVFLVSSLNHHISLLRLRVHVACVDFLETGRDAAAPGSGLPAGLVSAGAVPLALVRPDRARATGLRR